jgi:hypothetical protein
MEAQELREQASETLTAREKGSGVESTVLAHDD